MKIVENNANQNDHESPTLYILPLSNQLIKMNAEALKHQNHSRGLSWVSREVIGVVSVPITADKSSNINEGLMEQAEAQSRRKRGEAPRTPVERMVVRLPMS
jgi:hypothetical protein